MKKINLLYVWLLATLLIGCDDTLKQAVDSAVYPKTKGTFDIKSGKESTTDLAGLKGTISLDKEGEGKMKLSLKDFKHSGLENALSLDFNVTLSKIQSVPAYKIDFDKQTVTKDIDFTAVFPLSSTRKKVFNLSVDKIELWDKNGIRKMKLQTIVQPLLNSVEYKGTKYVGVVYTNSSANNALDIAFKVEQKKFHSSDIDHSSFLDWIKEPTGVQIVSVLRTIYTGNDAAAKSVLKAFLDESINKLKEAQGIVEKNDFILKADGN